MRTIIPLVLAPVFVQALLMFALLLLMGCARLRDLRERRLSISDMALGQNAWPEKTAQLGNAFNNQFQLPLLFFVLVVFVLMTGKQDYFFVVFEWLFVLLRIAHAYVHATSNDVRRRFLLFAAGAFVLIFMWIWYAIRIMAAI